MKENRITKRDNFTTIAGILAEAGHDTLVEFINHEIELLDNKAAKAKANAAKKKVESDALTDAVEAALTDELTIIADIAEKVEFEGETSIARVQYRLNALEKAGRARKEQITVGEGTSKRKLMAFARADVDAEVIED